MTDKIMTLADAYAEYRDHSEYVHCRAALAAAIKAEQDYTAAVMDERDAFCVEADVLRMALTALQSEHDRLRKVAQMALEAFNRIIWDRPPGITTKQVERMESMALAGAAELQNALRKELGE